MKLPVRLRRPSGSRSSPAWLTFAVLSGVAITASAIVVSPPKKSATNIVRTTTQVAGTPARDRDPAAPGRPELGAPVALPPGRSFLECAAGRNGGATDVGVSATEIKLGSTVVDSGVGASFLRDARYGMLAVLNAVNRSGGICGRKLKLILKDDGWKPDLGNDYIHNLVEDNKVFALAVVPSSEGLREASNYIKKKRIPVVGSDGMLIHQYTNPYVWPVAASTMSTMHIMVKQAYDDGARRFGIVYESTYHFGIEGAIAFNAAVNRVTKANVPGYSDPIKDANCRERFCGIAANQSSYGSQIEVFNNACLDDKAHGGKCDFVALLLEPATAISWLTGGGLTPNAKLRMGGPQPLFTRNFAQQCGTKCNGMWLWTGYDPPIAQNLGNAAIGDYVDAMRTTRDQTDFTNTFVEGAYIGMKMMVQALQTIGPDVNRERLVAALNSMTLDTGLTTPLTWRPGDHFANTSMQAWSIQYKDRFSGWRREVGSMEDPWVGQDIPE
jgi:ABC-type branched-subunit amino acid transport system substrate-binding protein